MEGVVSETAVEEADEAVGEGAKGSFVGVPALGGVVEDAGVGLAVMVAKAHCPSGLGWSVVVGEHPPNGGGMIYEER